MNNNLDYRPYYPTKFSILNYMPYYVEAIRFYAVVDLASSARDGLFAYLQRLSAIAFSP